MHRVPADNSLWKCYQFGISFGINYFSFAFISDLLLMYSLWDDNGGCREPSDVAHTDCTLLFSRHIVRFKRGRSPGAPQICPWVLKPMLGLLDKQRNRPCLSSLPPSCLYLDPTLHPSLSPLTQSISRICRKSDEPKWTEDKYNYSSVRNIRQIRNQFNVISSSLSQKIKEHKNITYRHACMYNVYTYAYTYKYAYTYAHICISLSKI